MTIEVAKQRLLNTAWLGTNEDRETTEEAVRVLIKAVEQEPKTGHWIPVYQGDEIIDYRCSECEFGSTFGKKPYGMYYCPKCGAKMEG